MRPDSGFVGCVNCLTGLLKHGFHSVCATHGKGSSFGKETAGLRDKTSELDPRNVALPYNHLATRRDSVSAPGRLAAGTKAMVSPSVIRPQPSGCVDGSMLKRTWRQEAARGTASMRRRSQRHVGNGRPVLMAPSTSSLTTERCLSQGHPASCRCLAIFEPKRARQHGGFPVTKMPIFSGSTASRPGSLSRNRRCR